MEHTEEKYEDRRGNKPKRSTKVEKREEKKEKKESGEGRSSPHEVSEFRLESGKKEQERDPKKRKKEKCGPDRW